jgi:vitamin B12 transporter
MRWPKTITLAIAFSATFLPLSPCLCTAGGDGAAEDDKEIKTYFGVPYIVTASRLGEALDRALKPVTVITSEDIARQQAVTVAEVLRNVPGVDVQSSGGTLGSTVEVRMRGADTDQVLVLIDGAQVNSTWLGSFNFTDLPAENIDRIEVVRGPASALYGSEAVGGVINIFSKRGDGRFKPSLTLEGGSLGTARAVGTASGGSGALDYSMTLSRLRSDGIADRDGYENTSFAGRLGIEASADKKIDFNARYVDGRKDVLYDFKYACDEFWNCTNFQTNDPNNSVENRNLVLSARYAHDVGERWDYSVTLAQINGTLVNDNAADPDPTFHSADPDTAIAYVSTIFNSSLDCRRSSAETQHNIGLLPWGVTCVGIEGEIEEAERTDFSNFASLEPVFTSVDVDRTNFAYFVQQKIDFGPPSGVPDWERKKDGSFMRLAREMGLSASAAVGVRIDDNSQFGSEASPKASAGLSAEKTGTSLTLIWAESYNAPSLTDLHYPGFSNPDLKPETSATKEISLRQKLFGHRTEGQIARAVHDVVDAVVKAVKGEETRLDVGSIGSNDFGLTIEASYFSTDYDDLIGYDMAFFKPNNIARAEIKGFEAGLCADYGRKTGAALTYTYLETEKWAPSDAEGQSLQRRPSNLLNLALWTGPFKGVRGRLDLNTSSSVKDNYDFIGADGLLRYGDRPGYTKVDLALSYALSERHRFHVKLENLFDEDYEEIKGYPAPGRTVLAGVTLSM